MKEQCIGHSQPGICAHKYFDNDQELRFEIIAVLNAILAVVKACKIQARTRLEPVNLYDTGALIYQLSYQANWELVSFCEYIPEPMDDILYYLFV